MNKCFSKLTSTRKKYGKQQGHRKYSKWGLHFLSQRVACWPLTKVTVGQGDQVVKDKVWSKQITPMRDELTWSCSHHSACGRRLCPWQHFPPLHPKSGVSRNLQQLSTSLTPSRTVHPTWLFLQPPQQVFIPSGTCVPCVLRIAVPCPVYSSSSWQAHDVYHQVGQGLQAHGNTTTTEAPPIHLELEIHCCFFNLFIY